MEKEKKLNYFDQILAYLEFALMICWKIVSLPIQIRKIGLRRILVILMIFAFGVTAFADDLKILGSYHISSQVFFPEIPTATEFSAE